MKYTLPLKRPGIIGSRLEGIKYVKKGVKRVETESRSEVPVEVGGVRPAQAGVMLELTIPGPKDSYKSAKIAAWCTLPTDPDDGSIRAAYERASGLVQEQIEKEAAAIVEYFSEG